MTDLALICALIFMWCWDYPADHPAKKFCQYFAAPFVYLGLWHGWSMFAPEPIHVNRRLRALLKFEDGVTEEWRPMGPDESNPLMKTLFARSFRYEHSLLGARVNQLYGPLCEFLESQCRLENPGRKLNGIELFRDFRVVNPWGSVQIYSELKSIPFYRYDVASRMGRVVPVASKPVARPPVAKKS